MRRLISFQVALLSVAVLSCPAGNSPEQAYSGLPRKCAKAFAWFDGLGFPDVRGRPLVRVATGGWSESDSGPREYHQQDGFLLETGTNGAFTVLTLDLFTASFRTDEEPTGVAGRISFQEIALEQEAQAKLEALKHPPADEDSRRRFGERIPERVEVFVLAWGCARNGLNSLAAALYEQAAKMPAPDRGWDAAANEKNGDFRQTLELDIGHALMWRAVVACGEPDIPRKELLAQFENILARYPASPHVPRAREMAGLLRQMIAEDEEHASGSLKSLAEMPAGERAEELIFQLRDQNGRQWSQPGACDVFMEFTGATNTPAHQLVAMGHAAVPQLIAALDDQRLTRSVGYHRDFYFSHHVLRVGDCALAVLCRIAGRSFDTNAAPSGCMTTDDQRRAVREQVQAWWTAIQSEGEQQVLSAGTASGDRDAPLQAETLLVKYPESVVEALAQGISRAEDAWIRTRLLEIANQIRDPAVIPLFLQEMEAAPFLPARVAAATALLMRTNEMAIRAMIREWQALPPPSADDWDGVESLIGFLASCDSPAAIRALAAGLPERPVDVRLAVVSAFKDNDRFMSAISSGSGMGLIDPDFEGKPLSAATLAEAEALLAAALDDPDLRSGASISWGSGDKRVSFNDPRICDMAGYILATRWPGTYEFNPATSEKTRDQQRIGCLNAYRKKKDLPPLPMPAARAVPPAPRDQIDPLLERIRNAPGRRAADKALNQLEQLGLPALPAVVEAIPCLDGNPVQEKVIALAARMAGLVTEVSLAENSLPAGPELTALFREIEGKPLTSDSYARLLETLVSNRPPTAKGVRLSAGRDDDLTGVTLRAEFVEHPEKEGGGSATLNDPNEVVWTWTERVTLNDASCHSSSGVGTWSNSRNSMHKAIDKALAAHPTNYFRISTRLAQIEPPPSP